MRRTGMLKTPVAVTVSLGVKTFYSQSAALEVFAKAMREFEATIPRDQLPEFGKFDSCESMLKVIEEEANRRPEKSRLLRCCKKISYFAKRWEPFFQIADLLVSSHPDWAALAWGAVRFVFKVSTAPPGRSRILPSETTGLEFDNHSFVTTTLYSSRSLPTCSIGLLTSSLTLGGISAFLIGENSSALMSYGRHRWCRR